MEVEGGTGEVYLYMGSKDGLEKSVHQVIAHGSEPSVL